MDFSDKMPSTSSPDLLAVFERDEIWNASDEELRQYLRTLNTQRIANITVQHRSVIQALTVNHIQLSRLIADLESRNKNTQFWFMVLAIGSLIVGAVSGCFSLLEALM